MTWQMLLIPTLLLITAGLAAVCMQAAWSRRKTPGAQPFAWMMLAVALWTTGAALEFLAADPAIKIRWAEFQYLGSATLPLFWLLFTAEYSQAAPTLSSHNRRALAALAGVPLAVIALAFTNRFHGLLWPAIRIVQTEPYLALDYTHGPAFTLMVVYGYALIALGAFYLAAGRMRFSSSFRRQTTMLIGGAALPWLLNLVYVAGLKPLPGFDLAPTAFLFTALVYAVEIFRYGLFDLVPVAQDMLIESLGDGVVVIDARERIVYANLAGRRLLQIDGRLAPPLHSRSPLWPELLAVARLQPAQTAGAAPLAFRLQDSPPLDIEVQIDALWRQRSSPTDARLPARPAGALAGKLIQLRDVTARKQAEQQLRLQSVAMAAAPNPIVITDRDGVIEWANPAFTRLTGYSIAEAAGQTPRLIKSGRHSAEFYRELWDTIAAGKEWRGEIVNRRKDGSFYVEDATIAPVLDAGGRITHYVALKQDITARKELEQARDGLTQAIIHDLRNPANNILFSLEVIGRIPGFERVPDEAAALIDAGRANAGRMLTLINAILDLSRLESGAMPLAQQAVDLADLAEETIRYQAQVARQAGVLLLNGVSSRLPPASVDRTLIGRVLQNLVDNAIKFAPPSSQVEITAEDCGEQGLVMAVHDDGPGIPFELRETLFQKFAAGASPRRGTGLGLAFCRMAVEAHSGRIWVEAGPDRGTTFRFSLPALRGDPPQPIPVAADPITTGPPPDITINR